MGPPEARGRNNCIKLNVIVHVYCNDRKLLREVFSCNCFSNFFLFGSNRGLLVRRIILFPILILSLDLFKIRNISNIAMQGFSKKVFVLLPQKTKQKKTIVELCIMVQTK